VTCADCHHATTIWHWGGIHANCRGCLVRSLAKSPRHVRERFYDIEQQRHGDVARAQLDKDVRAEYWRMQELRKGVAA
jgi:hypothetical protein